VETQFPADDTPSTQRYTLHLGFINIKTLFFLQQVFGATAVRGGRASGKKLVARKTEF